MARSHSRQDGAIFALPHSDEAERAVLGSILLDNDIMEEMSGDEPDLFYDNRHVSLFVAFQHIRESRAPIDLLTIQATLGEPGMEEIGGIAYLASLDLDLPDISRIESYLEILRDLQGRRRLMGLGLRVLAEAGSRDAGDARALAESMVRDAEAIATSRAPGGLVLLGEAMEAAAANLEAGVAAIQAVPTGFYDLDKLLGGGMSPKNLIIVAGRPGMGKTSFAMQVGIHCATKGYPAGVFSLEMGKEELALRVMAGELHSTYGDLKAGKIGRERASLPKNLAEEFLSYPISINDQGGQTVSSILSEARKANLRVIIIDYLQLITPRGRSENRNLELGVMTRELKGGAKDMDAVVIALSQLSREPEKRGDRRPQMSDLRESGAIENDADVIAFLYREDYYERFPERPGVTEVIIAKHRNGETGVVELLFESRYTLFRNLESKREPPRLR